MMHRARPRSHHTHASNRTAELMRRGEIARSLSSHLAKSVQLDGHLPFTPFGAGARPQKIVASPFNGATSVSAPVFVFTV